MVGRHASPLGMVIFQGQTVKLPGIKVKMAAIRSFVS